MFLPPENGEYMSLTIEQTDAAILSTFHSMEEGVDYVLNDFWFTEMNRVRKEYSYATAKHKVEFILSRKGEKFFLNGNEVFDFKDKTNLPLTLAFALALEAFAFALPFAFALQYNGIEKLNKDTCEGKVVEIDGKKYKLTAV
jgi:hypothetical protein